MSDGEDVDGQKQHKAISYVVVGINSISESKKLFKFLRANGYSDVSLFHEFPEGKDSSDTPISTLHQTAAGSSTPLNELYKSFNGTLEELFSNNGTTGKNTALKPISTSFCCALCGQTRPMVEARTTAKSKDQNIVLLSCLLMENDIELDTAINVYKETHSVFKRICQLHFIRAASFIGREIKEMWGKFPLHGLHYVPPSIVQVFLAHIQIFGDCIDEKVVLETHDVTRFFNESFARYYGADGWNVEEMDVVARKYRKRKQSSPLSDDLNETTSSKPKINASSSDDHRVSPLWIEPKKEPRDEDQGILATDLLEQSMPSPSSAATFESNTSVKDCRQGSATSEKDRKKSRSRDKKEATVPVTINPTKITQEQYSCMDALADKKFRERFRMSRSTFKKLCDALDPLLEKRCHNTTRSSTTIKVGTALEVLAGNGNALKGLSLMGTSVTEIFGNVLDALLEWSGTVIQWPGEEERERIRENFFESTSMPGIVGCLDGTIIGTQSSSDTSSKGSRALNVAVVVDDNKLFRWVLAKYRAEVADDLVFKRSLLYEQLKEGVKEGRLIGDDAYEKETFLVTPSTEKDKYRANALREAHKIVEEAIASWKWQFPILTSDITSPKVARIIVGSAALYNLTRLEGEPEFTADNEEMDVSERCIDVL
ncbi:hypothetical protein RB195_004544 [Necator americanus]|uniref:DDE Tnp4 domain-containing protein n=1 Tax=Necator americanus TaxID=51031 RepID=A0ABR1BN00_NECAM